MRRTVAILVALALAAAPVAACGSDDPEQTAEQFCAEHGGVAADTVEPDGDATCTDGTEYEAEGESASESDDKKKKKSSRRRK